MKPHIGTRKLRGLSPGDESWLKEHTVKDLRNLVFEMYSLGEDVSGMVPVVNYFEDLEHKLVREQQLMTGKESDFDVLDLVREYEYVVA